MDGVNEPDENGEDFKPFGSRCEKNKPLDESRKTGQTSRTKMAFYSMKYYWKTTGRDAYAR
ncbi:hypothetical protein Hanom_Chr10g00886831 [Helianthus anomalus]